MLWIWFWQPLSSSACHAVWRRRKSAARCLSSLMQQKLIRSYCDARQDPFLREHVSVDLHVEHTRQGMFLRRAKDAER